MRYSIDINQLHIRSFNSTAEAAEFVANLDRYLNNVGKIDISITDTADGTDLTETLNPEK